MLSVARSDAFAFLLHPASGTTILYESAPPLRNTTTTALNSLFRDACDADPGGARRFGFGDPALTFVL